MTKLLIDPGALHPVALHPPPSKSDAQRALVLAHLLRAEGEEVPAPVEWPALHGPIHTLPDDVRVVYGGLAALVGATAASIDCGDGGAPFRLLLSQAAIAGDVRTEFLGSKRLGERPHRPLFEALKRTLGPAGLQLEEGSPWPVHVRGATGLAETPRFVIDVRESSQFASSLLLAACALHLRERRPWTVELVGEEEAGSAGYLALTVQWAERCGFTIAREGHELRVTGHAAPPRWPDIPGDWSSLGYLVLLAWASGGEAAGVDLSAAHPDRAVVRILEETGLGMGKGTAPDRLRVSGRPLRGVAASGAECPDLLPTLAAFACLCPSPSTLTHVHLLRAKESDRVQGIRDLVAAAGGSTELDSKTHVLTVHPPERIRPFSFHSRGDHRMAMCASVLGVLGRVRVELEEPECVSKSFPGFFEELASLGVALTPL